MSIRQDYIYPNLPRTLVEVVDVCVANILQNGTQVYDTRKDFIVKAIHNLINQEKVRNPTLSKKIDKQLLNTPETTVITTNTKKRGLKVGGNRIHVTK